MPRAIASPDCADAPDSAAICPIFTGSAASDGPVARPATTMVAARMGDAGRHFSSTDHSLCMARSCFGLPWLEEWDLTGRVALFSSGSNSFTDVDDQVQGAALSMDDGHSLPCEFRRPIGM